MSDLVRLITRYIASLFRVPRDNPALVAAKLAAFARQVPMMYALVIINTLALSVTHYAVAPRLLTVYIPGALDVACLARAAMWWRGRHRRLTFEQSVGRLKSTIIFAGILGTVFSAWSLSLFRYGDAYAQSHVAFFMAVTVIACSFCLMHLRIAALLVMTLVTVPFTIFFISIGNIAFVSIAVNFFLVTIVLSIMQLINYDDFEKRVNSEQALLAKQGELQSLSDRHLKNSHIDHLTGLANRLSCFAELERHIENAENSDNRVILAILDLDGFKAINDVHGHRVGDRLLARVGERLRAHFPPRVALGRLGGDEYFICSNRRGGDEALDRAEAAVVSLFEAPFQIDDITIRIGCSIGYAEFPRAAKTAEDLFERADYALFFAKKHGRGTAVGFSEQHEATIREAGNINQALANADLDRELWIAYQPIVDAESSLAISFEALARWKSPVLGDVPPMSFILAAERSGLISKLTPLLLQKALQGASTWPEHIRISFNLSALDIASPLSILKIIDVIEKSGVNPRRIDFEITETAVMHHMAQACEALNALKALGASISLDDFGTGYSSLSCIRELPIDKVKIDRSFISHIEAGSASSLILKTMIGLCANLNLDCVVEGVETTYQMEFLRDEGSRLMQGYLFAKPMSSSRVRDYLAACDEITFRDIVDL